MGSHDHLGVRAQEGHVTNTRNDQEQGHDSSYPKSPVGAQDRVELAEIRE